MILRDMLAPVNRLDICEANNGLLITLFTRSSRLEGVFVALFVGVCVAMAGIHFFRPMILVGLVLLAVGLAFARVVRERRIDLLVTNLEFRLVRSDFGVGQVVCSADVKWLEHQDGGEDEPEGLYALLRFGKVCVLPHANPAEADQVIDRIEKRFPDMAERWRASGTPFDRHFITLGLSSPKPDS